MPPRKPLTEEDIKWCNEALANAEPYSDEENPLLILDDRLFHEPIDEKREKATKAKRMLERGWKY